MVVISRVISPLIGVISIVTLLITLLITAPEPPSSYTTGATLLKPPTRAPTIKYSVVYCAL